VTLCEKKFNFWEMYPFFFVNSVPLRGKTQKNLFPAFLASELLHSIVAFFLSGS